MYFHQNFQTKRIINLIDLFFSFDKKKIKSFFIDESFHLNKELREQLENEINIKNFSKYEKDETNCIFIKLDKNLTTSLTKQKIIKLKPNLLIAFVEKDADKKFILPFMESKGYRIFYELKQLIFFYFYDNEFKNLKFNKVNNIGLEIIKRRWSENFIKGNKNNFLEIDPRLLLSSKRFDIAIKSNYARLAKEGIGKNWREFLYIEHLKIITGPGDTIKEYDRSGKEGIKDFINNFERLINEKDQLKIPIIPISRSFIPMDGAHRIASAIINKKKVNCIKFEKDYSYIASYKFFSNQKTSKKKFPKEILDESCIEYCRIKNNAAIAFLFPSVNDHFKGIEILGKNSNIICKKELHFTPNAGKKLLRQIYLGQEWLDWNGKDQGFNNKHKSCFPYAGKLTVVLFDEFKIEEIREIKNKIRKIYKIGNHSIHITDSKEETLLAAKIVFNQNSIDFLNHSTKVLKMFHKNIFKLKDLMLTANIDSDYLCIDSGGVLSAYGLRDSKDIDFLYHGDPLKLSIFPDKISCHNDFSNLFDQNIEEIISDPRNHFWYLGIKFCTPKIVQKMKLNRNEIKDKKDVILLNKVIPSKKYILIQKIFINFLWYLNYLIFGFYSKLKRIIKKFI